MKVRIVKSERQTYWYAAQIGCIFNVQQSPHDENGWSVSGMEDEHRHYIVKSDCEILPEENQPEPFDLERALKGEKVVTRNGRVVTEIIQFKTAEKTVFCVGGVCDGEVAYWDIEGHFTPISGKSSRDLFMAPRESEYVTKWANVWHSTNGYFFGSTSYDSEGAAESVRNFYTDYIGAFPITFKRPK